MDSDIIRNLMKKYWECETSLKEEKMLREVFRRGDVPEDLLKYTKLFAYYDERREQSLSSGYENRILDLIEANNPDQNRRFRINLYKVAAAIILILSFFIINQRVSQVNDQAKKVVVDTFEDPEKALEETKKALYFVSEKLKIGTRQASKISKFKKAEEVVKNTNYKEI